MGRLKATKTNDTRDVEVSVELATTLRRHLTWLKTETLRQGWGEPPWLFPSQAGTPLDQSKVTKVFRDALKRAGLLAIRLYDLRHTFACLLLAANAPITYVSAQLGHSNPTTTLRHYARWIPSKGQRWVDAPDAARSGSKMVATAGSDGSDGVELVEIAGAGGGT